MKSNRYSWPVKPLHRRRSVTAALLAPRPKSTKAVTMPTRNMTMLTDADVGLPDDPMAQQRAEEAICAAISYRLRQEARGATIQAVEVPLDDESITIRDVPPDVLDGISAELRRIGRLPGEPPEYSLVQT